ncbi:hypothetical protein FBR02_16240 [Anaerolineae bacterium CFX9]|nr:hypothetical protein [Anaerolineae bacterium CFX9]
MITLRLFVLHVAASLIFSTIIIGAFDDEMCCAWIGFNKVEQAKRTAKRKLELQRMSRHDSTCLSITAGTPNLHHSVDR